MNLVEGFTQDMICRGLTPHTVEVYRSNVQAFLRSHEEPMEVKTEDLKAFLEELRLRNLKGSTLKSTFAAVSSFYEWLIFDGIAENNPVPPFRKRFLRIKDQHGGENTRQLISIEDMSRLVNQASKELPAKAMMLFLAKTGLRRGELIAMDLEDLDIERMEFRVKPKAKRSNRLGFLDHETQAVMYEYLEWREKRAQDKALWISSSGSRISRNIVYYTVTRYADLAGLHRAKGAMSEKLTPHCFRHWFTTHLRRAGMPREFIQELRGDRRKDAFDIYDHIDPAELKKSYMRLIPSLGTGPGKPGTLEEWLR